MKLSSGIHPTPHQRDVQGGTLYTGHRPGPKVLVLALWISLSGCDLAQEAKERVVTQHRAQAPGRVGMLRGMEVQSRAAQVGDAIAHRNHEDCPVLPKGPVEVRISLKAVIHQDNQEDLKPATLEEDRVIRLDAAGNLEATWEARFKDPSGRTSTWKRQERVHEGWHYVAEENLPFTRRRARRHSAQIVKQRAMDVIPSLLASAQDTWRPGAQDRHWVSDGSPGLSLRCDLPAGDQAWTRRLLEVTSPSAAKAELALDHQSITMDRESEGPKGPLLLRVQAHQEIKPGAVTAVTLPERMETPGRVRPYRDIQRILGVQMGLSQWRP